MVCKKNTRLTLKERVQIETLSNENKTKAYIAKKLNRSRSKISREVNKWVINKADKYNADLANWCAKDDFLNKRNTDKISTHKKIRFYIFKRLLSGSTPEQIAGRLKLEYPNNVIIVYFSRIDLQIHLFNASSSFKQKANQTTSAS